jgi:hypothetical protein
MNCSSGISTKFYRSNIHNSARLCTKQLQCTQQNPDTQKHAKVFKMTKQRSNTPSHHNGFSTPHSLPTYEYQIPFTKFKYERYLNSMNSCRMKSVSMTNCVGSKPYVTPMTEFNKVLMNGSRNYFDNPKVCPSIPKKQFLYQVMIEKLKAQKKLGVYAYHPNSNWV